MRVRALHFGLGLMLVAGWGWGCSFKPQAPPDADGHSPVTYDRIDRTDFNRLAVELNLPLFWTEDGNSNNGLDPSELAVLWGQNDSRGDWLQQPDGFTPRFAQAYERVVKLKTEGHAKPASTNEAARRAAVLLELAQGRPTAIASNFTAATAEDKAVVSHILQVADVIERIHALQRGTLGMERDIPGDDPASAALFHRNQGPWCEAPQTMDDPNCSALPSKPPKISGMYPAELQSDKNFCETLAADKNAKALLEPFVVVKTDASGALTAVPYNVAYKEEMEAASKILQDAAESITSLEEAAFEAYLRAASQAFLDNNWVPADEAWSKMNVNNSKWYLRVGPDEVYFEPCSRKAGFHVSFARINQDSKRWQEKLDPVKNEMENAVAILAGRPYKARKVSFHLPDFIDMVLNAGDSRPAHGATIGQSLPNWGPVANEGRGRTVAMTNISTDADSKRALQEQVESLFCKASMASFTTDPEPQLMSTVLHEASHNLGPSHEYEVEGKTDDEIFGGPLASTLEELKAQTGALYYTHWLVEKGLIDKAAADEAHTRDVVWAFGHISRGMYEDGKPKAYSQLAAIQMGFLVKEGALLWNAEEQAANGKDKGCFMLSLDRFPAAIEKLTIAVFGIKGRGDKKAAEALKRELVDDETPWKALRATITERVLRSPKGSFVYAIDM